MGFVDGHIYLNIILMKKNFLDGIDLNDEPVGFIAQFRNEGFKEGQKSVLELQLENHSIEEVAKFTNLDVIEIRKILSG